MGKVAMKLTTQRTPRFHRPRLRKISNILPSPNKNTLTALFFMVHKLIIYFWKAESKPNLQISLKII